MAYHIAPNGPRLCHAKKGRCPYGADGAFHFQTISEAILVFEKRMAETFGGFERVKKTLVQKRRETNYAMLDRFKSLGRSIATSDPVFNAQRTVQSIKNAPVNLAVRVKANSQKIWRGITKFVEALKDVGSSIRDETIVARDRFRQYSAPLVSASAEGFRAYREAFKAAEAEYHQQRVLDNMKTPMIHKQNFTTPKSVRPESLRVGDQLPNGSIVAKIRIVDGVASITARDSKTGQFTKGFKVPMDSQVSYSRPSRGDIRQGSTSYAKANPAAVHRAKVSGSNARMRAKMAKKMGGIRTSTSASQERSFRDLIDIDRSVGIADRWKITTNAQGQRSIHSLRMGV